MSECRGEEHSERWSGRGGGLVVLSACAPDANNAVSPSVRTHSSPRPPSPHHQRDVPGMTRAAIPILASQGVRALSSGVNGFSAPPGVPKVGVCVWLSGQGGW